MKKIILSALGIVLIALFGWILFVIVDGNFNVMGGSIFMNVLNLLFAGNMALILYLIYSVIQDKPVNERTLDAVKQIGGLAAAWGAWSTIIGFFYAFDGIESSPEALPIQVIAGGLKVGLITVLYGLIILCHALLGYIGLNLSRN